MLAQSNTRAPRATGRRPALASCRNVWRIGLLLAPLLVQGCAATPPAPVAGRNPADPAARVAPVAYRSTVGPYQSQRPREPGPWREQNERVAPQQKP
jgi:hypothetical protein